MRLASVRTEEGERGAVVGSSGPVLLEELNRSWGTAFPDTLWGLVAAEGVADLAARVGADGLDGVPVVTDPRFAPPWRRPGKIWGIGLNYAAHAGDLGEGVPPQPASFMRPATSIVGPGDAIVLPAQSQRVTAEAELAVLFGGRVRNASGGEVARSVVGLTCVIDVTAEDILRQNPRYLTRAKSFDTFFSFGPVVLTLDEVPDLSTLVVRTVVNGEVRAENTVANMTHDPWELVRFHSHVMTWEPGDVLSTGTPGAFPIEHGDVVRCEITGFPPLESRVQSARAAKR